MKNIVFIILLPILLIESIFAQNANNESAELQKRKANLAAAQHDTSRIFAYIIIGIYFRDSINNPDSALVYGLKAGQLAEHYPHYSQTPRVWNTIGLSYKKLHNLSDNETLKKRYFDLAEKHFKKCMYEAKKVGNLNQMAAAWFYLSDLYMESSKKYDYFKTSFELINYLQKKTSWNSLDSMILRKTYKLLCASLDYEIGSKKQNEYLQNCKKLIPKEGQDYEQLCLLEFEQHALLWKKKDEKRLLEEYHQYKKTIKANYHIDELDECLAQYYFSIQEYEKSFQLMDKFSSQNYDKLKIMPNAQLAPLGVKYMIMGKSAYMLNRNQEAIHYLNKAIHYINPIEYSVGLENEKYTTYLYLGKAYKKAGQYKEALACNEQADVLYKQIHDVGVQALMAENDVHLEEIKQEKKLQEARTQTLLKEQEIEIQKKQKYTFLAISILALLSASWAVYSFIKTRKQNNTIQKQAVALAESNQLKDKIFALLSHDLRSPINRLVMSLNQSIESQRNQIQSELKGVQDILNNVLYWASMQLKGITPINRELPLKALVDSIENEYHVILKDKNITFLNSIDSKLIIKTDENCLKIIIRNLISNAIKFTEQTGYIQIYCKENEDNLEIGLKDTGIGIPAEKLKNIYNYPESSLGTRHETGNGIGLSLSMEIAKKLNGILKINSIEQKGTVVQLILNK